MSSGPDTKNRSFARKARNLAYSDVVGVSTYYGYDHLNQRVLKVIGTATTTYPNMYFNTSGATTTAHIFLPDGRLVTTIEGNGISTTTSYIHPDHLGSTSVVTDGNGDVVQTLDYYPFGDPRIKSGTDLSQREYIGQEYDEESELSYLQARYYSGQRGQFLSQDPVFWEVGQTADGNAVLSNPQAQNSYSYAGNNPITNKDPNGRFWWQGFYDWSGYNGMSGVMMKAGEVFGGHTRAMNAIRANQSTINSTSQNYGVDPRLTTAVMYEEQSHLTPDEALGREQLFPNIGVGGVGVMQVSGPVGSQYGGYTKAELARDPVKNINSGTAYLGSIQNNFSAANQSSKIIGIGTQYNGSTAYGQRINAQMSNPNYNTNVIISGLQSIVSSLEKIVSSLKK